MKICLINPPVEMKYRYWYPIGIGYVASFLLKAGFEVEIIDCIGDNLSRAGFKEQLAQSKADAFGIGGLIMAFNNVVEISYMIKQMYPDAFIFAGNTVACTIPEVLISNSAVQVVIMWEGEYTVVNLMKTIKNGNSLETVKGIVFRNKDGEFIKTTDQPVIRDLDELPLPAWDLIPMENYFKNTVTFPISTVRGCPYNCIYCCKTFLLNKVRARSPQHVINEMVEAQRQFKFKIKRVAFFDDLFMYNKKRVIEFCNLKMSTPLIKSLPWDCSGRVNLITEEIVKKMIEANCVSIGCGFESADQEVLDYYKKGTTVEQAQKAIDIMKKYNIEFSGSGSFMIGAPNETYKTVKKTVKFCKKNNLRYLPHFTTPYPGTVLYSWAREQGLIGDELEYIKKISKIGNTNYLTVNLTKFFTDEELSRLKKDMTYYPSANLSIALKRRIEESSKIIELLFTKGLRETAKEVKRFLSKSSPQIKLELYSNEWF